MIHSSCLELSESALRKNIKFLRAIIGREVKFTSVIKGNAYGHGIEAFLPLAERCGVRSFAVYSADEALRAQNSRTAASEIIILGQIDPHDLDWALEHDISIYVFELGRLEAAIQAAGRLGRPARVHLELETGLNRTGFDEPELERLVALCKKHADKLQIEGICTHYAGADSVGNYLRIQQQIALFRSRVELLQERGLTARRLHSACSAAALVYPETRLDMVRFGIAQYGYWPSEETRMHYYLQGEGQKETASGKGRNDPLRRVLRWKSQVLSVKRVRPGEFVSYGTTYLTTRSTRVAAIPVGYYHGFARKLSNQGHVLVCGRRAPVVGVVNMNMMLVDITDIPAAKPGEEVVIIGRQKKAHIPVSSFSDMSRALNYEVLVRLPADIPRVIVP